MPSERTAVHDARGDQDSGGGGGRRSARRRMYQQSRRGQQQLLLLRDLDRTDRDRDLPLRVGRLLGSGRGREARLRALGGHGERERRHPGPPGAAQDRRRREQPEPGRDQLREPHHEGQGRSRDGPVLHALERARGRGCQPLPLRVRRARRRRARHVREAPAERVLRAAGARARVRRSVREVHQVAAGGQATEDGRLPVARRPVLGADRRADAEAVRGGGDQDRLPDDLPARDHATSPRSSRRLPPRTRTWSWAARSRTTRTRR